MRHPGRPAGGRARRRDGRLDRRPARSLELFGPGPVVVGPPVERPGHAPRQRPGGAVGASGRRRLAGRAAAGPQPTSCCPSGRSPATVTPAATSSTRSTCRWCEAATRCSRRWRRTSSRVGSLEATARALFVHPNTVRYRLRQVGELTGFIADHAARRVHAARSRWCWAGSPGRAEPAGPARRLVGFLQKSRPVRFVRCRRRAHRPPTRQSGGRARHRRSRTGRPDPRLPHALARGRHASPSRFDWLSTVAGLDLAHYGTEADADADPRHPVAQPLLVATGLVAALRCSRTRPTRSRRSAPSPVTASARSTAAAGARRHHRRAGHGARPRARQGDGRGRRRARPPA